MGLGVRSCPKLLPQVVGSGFKSSVERPVYQRLKVFWNQ